MYLMKLKQLIFTTKTGKVVGSAYLIYLSFLMIGSIQLGVQLGTELKSVPEDQRMEYVSTFLSKNL